MSKGNLVLNESKTKVDLTLESKKTDLKWSEATWKWSTADSTWAAPKISASLESKTKVDLTKESK